MTRAHSSHLAAPGPNIVEPYNAMQHSPSIHQLVEKSLWRSEPPRLNRTLRFSCLFCSLPFFSSVDFRPKFNGIGLGVPLFGSAPPDLSLLLLVPR